MIDFIRLVWNDNESIKNALQNDRTFDDAYMQYNVHTGEDFFPLKSSLQNMDIVVHPTYGFINNSIHKLPSFQKSGVGENYSDLTYSQLNQTIGFLESELPCINEAHFTQLEFGLNIETSCPAEKIIEENVLMHGFKGYSHNMKFNGKGAFLQYDHTEYELKLYDKAKQNELNKNLLRLEIRIRTKRVLNSLGVYQLNDLKSVLVLEKLFDHFRKRISQVKIVDYVSENHNMTTKDYNSFIKFRDPRYWNVDLKGKSKSNTKSRRAKEFRRLLNKYNLKTTQTELLRLVDHKFNQLINN